MADQKHVMQMSVTLDGATRKADRSVTMRFTSTMEMSNLDFAMLDRLHQSSGWLLFRPNEFDPAEVPTEDAPDDGKRPSQRLRAVLYIYWRDHTDQSEPFQQYYVRWMERKINEVKDHLE